MSKLRLDYFLMLGGLVVDRDLVSNSDGRKFTVELGDVSMCNKDEPENKSCYIESFTPRKNNGKQPMPDDFPIVATLVCGNGINRTAWQVRWSQGASHHTDIESWTPDLEKLLEQQNEYDEAQAESDVMISEKEMMIVNAVNELGKHPERSVCSSDCVGMSKGAGSIYEHGEFHFVTLNNKSNRYWRRICTIEEYDKCIEEMSEGAFVPSAKPEFVYGQDIYLKDGAHKDKNLKFGCGDFDGNGAIILYEGGYAYVKLSDLSNKPFKTKEEIELEEAKKSQLEKVKLFVDEVTASMRYQIEGNDLLFKEMQEAGLFAEILLPLKSK